MTVRCSSLEFGFFFRTYLAGLRETVDQIKKSDMMILEEVCLNPRSSGPGFT